MVQVFPTVKEPFTGEDRDMQRENSLQCLSSKLLITLSFLWEEVASFLEMLERLRWYLVTDRR